MILLPLLLIIIPILAYKWAKSNHSDYKFTILGASYGSIALLFSMGLFATFFLIPYFGFPIGIFGGAMVMFHGSPGRYAVVHFGVVPSGIGYLVIISIINGFFWGVIYGGFGFIIDKYRSYRKSPNN